MRDLAYLKLLSREYPNIRAAASDIINLQAICGLPTVSYTHLVMIECQIGSDDKVFPMVPAGKPIEEAFDEIDLRIE